MNLRLWILLDSAAVLIAAVALTGAFKLILQRKAHPLLQTFKRGLPDAPARLWMLLL